MPKRIATRLKWSILLAGIGAALLSGAAQPQSFKELKTPSTPLVLKSRGSFYFGGESREQTPVQVSSLFGEPLEKGGHVTVNQMYVDYMVPAKVTGVPVIMVHGNTLTGKSYDTTPDGRMGWFEYFVRKGHPTYVPDQISRGRSGVDVAIYNEVRKGLRPPAELPGAFRQTDELNWGVFRFGPRYGEFYPDEQFPREAVAAMATQAVPVYNSILGWPDTNIKAMADLAEELGGAVLMGHSQTGALPPASALVNRRGLKGLVMIEPGFCPGTELTAEQLKVLTTLPILVVFGDHLDAPSGLSFPGRGEFKWTNGYDSCMAFIARVNAAKGNAQMLYPPDLGIHGNSHMIMLDRNNLQIADLILAWIRKQVR